MKNLLLLSVLLFICQYTFSQITFEKSYKNETIYSGLGRAVIAEDDGYFLSGLWYEKVNFFEHSVISLKGSVLIRTNLSGDTLWTKTFPDELTFGAHLISKSTPKEYVFLGNPSNLNTKSDIKVTKIDSLGNVIWNNTIINPNWDVANQIIQTNDDGYLIVGQTNSLIGVTAPHPYDAYIVKLNSKGDTLWTKMVGDKDYDDYAYGAIETSDSHYLITGYCHEGKVLLIKMNIYGDTLWTKKYGADTPKYYYRTSSVAETKDKNYIIVGTRDLNSTSSSDVYVLKVDKEGNVLWEKTYQFNGNSFGSKVLVLDSDFLIAGGNDEKALLLKIGDEGNLLWSKIIMSFDANAVNSIDKCNDGGFIFTTSNSLSLFKTDAEGCIKPNILPVVGESNVSINDNIIFEINDVRGTAYTWESTHGTILSGQGTNRVIMYWNEIGLDTVKVFVENDCGVESSSFNVNIQECVPFNASKIQSSNFNTEFYVEKYEGKNPTYLWSVDKGTILSGQNSNHIKVNWNESGNAKISVNITNDCSMFEDNLQIIISHVDNIAEDKINIFPNPTIEGEFYISNNHDSDILVQIYNITGEKIVSNVLNRSVTQRYDVSEFGKGMFIVKFSDDNSTFSKKIISR